MSKKLVQINSVCNGSTGKIMISIQKEAENEGYEVYNFFGRGNPANDRCFKFCNKLDIYWHVLITRLFDKHGFGCKRVTKKLVKKLREIKPDVVQLHNIHGYYTNIEILFNYLKESNVKVIWTLHDCWAFTGHCAHFTLANCDKWKSECKKCQNRSCYPNSLFDNSKHNFKVKMELFTGIKNFTIVTPSQWLYDLVKQSFLGDYDVKVINNGIDLNIFKPTYNKEIYIKYNISCCKKIILGVASVWNEKKGLNDIIKLSKIINDNYVILLVGLNKKQINDLGKLKINNIIGIERTENQIELASLYSIAHCFVNTTYEDNFPTVNIEALACGTPVITYNTGGSAECISNDENGKIVDVGNIIKLKEKVYKIEKNDEIINKCVETAKQYDQDLKYKEYLKIMKG